jgi:hypothetical protein
MSSRDILPVKLLCEDVSFPAEELDSRRVRKCNLPSCFTISKKLLACGGCLTVSYCCSSHQEEDWKFHRAICDKFQEMEMKGLSQRFSIPNHLPYVWDLYSAILGNPGGKRDISLALNAIELGADVNYQLEDSGFSPLLTLCENNSFGSVDTKFTMVVGSALIGKGANVNINSTATNSTPGSEWQHSSTPLKMCARHGKFPKFNSKLARPFFACLYV